jgi:hypothetical protein
MWKAILSKHGALGLIAVFLVLWLANSYTTFAAKIEAVTDAVFHHAIESQHYLRGICLNVAETPQEIANCQPPQILGPNR